MAFLPELVWNKGIASLCDWRIPDEFPDGRYAPNPVLAGENFSENPPSNLIGSPEVYAGIREGDLVWVRISWLNSFITQVLPLISARFVLVTGDADSSVPSSIQQYADAVLRNPNVICWFAQNCDASPRHARFRPVPIGIDFHTLSERQAWGENMSSLCGQETELKAIAGNLAPVEERTPDVYIDFALLVAGYGGRLKMAGSLARNRRAVFERRFLPRTEMWRRRGQFAFVASPEGFGMDCHRTWEALALGHIVLAPRSPLEPMFRGLAVEIIDDWSAITPANLSRWLKVLGPLTRSNPILTSRWWIDQIRAAAGRTESAADR